MKKNKLQVYIFSFLGMAFILFALWPWLAGFWYKVSDNVVEPEMQEQVLISDETFINATSSKIVEDDSKTLVIPSIGVDIPIIISDNGEQALGQGAWHIPGSGIPTKSDDYKNIVISAHRFLYTSGPHTFFNLDKVKSGEDIIINWEGKEYKYRVTEIFVVEPDQVSILEDDGREKLTLFTCTPVFTTDKRLVVVAYPI